MLCYTLQNNAKLQKPTVAFSYDGTRTLNALPPFRQTVFPVRTANTLKTKRRNVFQVLETECRYTNAIQKLRYWFQ